MMKTKLMFGVSLLLLHLCAHAMERQLFNVVATGSPAPEPIKITVCLNAASTPPLSCETNYVNSFNLMISTTIPNRTYPDAGIFVNTPGYSIASSGIACKILANGYCSFSISSVAPKSISLFNAPRFVYIGNFSTNYIPQCPVNADGSLGQCTYLTGPDVNGNNLFDGPTDIVFNSAGTSAYIANYNDDNIIKCNVSASGTFSGCSQQVVVSMHGPYPQNISLNNTETYAYIGIYPPTLTSLLVCKIDSAGNLNSAGCQLSPNPASGYATKVLFDSTGTIAYVGSSDSANNYMYVCDVDSSTGLFTNTCTTQPSVDANLNAPSGIAFNPAKSIIYAANNYNSWNSSSFPPISNCTFDSLTSLACADSGASSSGSVLGSSPTGIAINAAGTFAYVGSSNFSSSPYKGFVVYCPIDSSGLLGACQNTGGGIPDYTWGVALLY